MSFSAHDAMSDYEKGLEKLGLWDSTQKMSEYETYGSITRTFGYAPDLRADPAFAWRVLCRCLEKGIDLDLRWPADESLYTAVEELGRAQE